MDISDYRRRYEEELQHAADTRTGFAERLGLTRASGQPGIAPPPPHEDDLRAAIEVSAEPERDPRTRVEAIQIIGAAVARQPELIDLLLELLRDEGEPSEVRKASLRALQQATFLVAAFAPKRPAVLDALRSTVEDPDPELRRRVLGILAREKDEYAQRRLMDGLEKRSKPLVPAAKAIQFLGYDVHAEYFPLLRRIVEHPPNRAARREAIRLLAADPSSRELLSTLLDDRDEDFEVRSLSAAGLQSLAPGDFEEIALRIAGDEGEDERLRATCLTALVHFASPGRRLSDPRLRAAVERLDETSSSRQVKRASRDYLYRFWERGTR